MKKNKLTTFSLPKFLQRTGAIELLIFLSACIIYANTLGHQFAQDDAIVIYDNVYVQDGLSGIAKILTTDSFSGFFEGQDKSSLVSGGRYRPLTMVLFSVLYEFFGPQPAVYHVLSTISYALLCLLLFRVINSIKTSWSKEKQRLFALMATFIFLVHPVHTEVVANVKGLDETFSLLFSLLALWASSVYVRKQSLIHLFGAVFSLFIALLSKENAIAFLFIIPIVLIYIDSKTQFSRRKIIVSIILLVTVGIYWLLRVSVVGSDFGTPPAEMMNNPFIKFVGGQYQEFTLGERWSTIIYGMGKYIQLLFFPHPLTHDYYPRHIGVMTTSDISVWLALLMNIAAGAIAIIGIRKRSFVSFCIIFFYLTIGLMSNILFPIGTHLSERFLFTPSVAIALLGAYGFMHLYEVNRYKKYASTLFIFIMMLGSLKTMSRNASWYDDLTLFTTDVNISKNSAKIRNAAGGALLTASLDESNPVTKNKMISDAIAHLNEAVKIHPNYKEAHLLMGNGYSYLKDYDQSIISYDNALKINPYYDQATENLIIVLREGAREAGSVRKDYNRAINYLSRALRLNPDDAEATALMGTAYGSAGNHLDAIKYFEKVIKMRPNSATTYINLGLAQLNAGLEEEAQISFNQAIQIDPRSMDQINQSN